MGSCRAIGEEEEERKAQAQDPPKGSLPARVKVSNMGVSDPNSHAQVQVRGQAWSSLAEVSEVAGVQRHSSSTIGVKGSSRKATELPLKVLPIFVWSPSAQNASPSPSTRGDAGGDCFEAKGGEDSLLTNAEAAAGVVSSILRYSDLKKVATLRIEEALALSLQGAVSVCVSAFFDSYYCCVNVIC